MEDNLIELTVEYTIPKEIDDRIPANFYSVMASNLEDVFGSKIFDELPTIAEDEDGNYLADEDGNYIQDWDNTWYNLYPGTGGWYTALKATCQKLNMDWFFKYCVEDLKWYELDALSDIICDRIIDKLL